MIIGDMHQLGEGVCQRVRLRMGVSEKADFFACNGWSLWPMPAAQRRMQEDGKIDSIASESCTRDGASIVFIYFLFLKIVLFVAHIRRRSFFVDSRDL